MDCCPDGALGCGLEGVAEVDDECSGDRRSRYPSAVLFEDFEAQLIADLVEESKPPARVLVRTYALASAMGVGLVLHKLQTMLWRQKVASPA